MGQERRGPIRQGLDALRQGHLQEALSQFDRLLGEEPNLVGVRYLRGLTLYRLGRTGDALDEARACLEIDPAYEPALELIDRCRRSAGLASEPAAGSAQGQGRGSGAGSGATAGAPGTWNLGALPYIDPESYIVADEFARGGMGRIMRAVDRNLDRTVALKELLGDAGQATRRFLREAFITARLQHPAIVPIYEAGRWPTGAPFYAMKLVRGRSLAEMLREATTLPEKLALLPKVIVVAEAMAYAHSQRIIHRDLKPENILCGEFGETVVIDWGLAKDLSLPAESDEDDALDRAAAAVRAAASAPSPDTLDHRQLPTLVDPHAATGTGPTLPLRDAGATEAGAVIGTPSYMPPEQARGALVDQRADVYALGAILYCVLAGDPPFAGQSYYEVLYKLARTTPEPLAQRQPGLPQDLLDIVDKAMAREAADRYPHAGALVEDLRRFQTGQLVSAHRYTPRELVSRWVRRHLALVILAVAALLTISATATLAVRNVLAERADAERSRAEAERLIGFMLNDLHAKLEPLGRLDLLDELSKQALAQLQKAGRKENESSARNRSLALSQMGLLLVARGNLGEALVAHQSTLAILEGLARKSPEDPDLRRELAVARMHVADVLRAQGRLDPASLTYQGAQRTLRSLLRREPGNTDWQRLLAVALTRQGSVQLAQGRLVRALEAFEQAQAIAERLLRSDPRNLEWQRDLSVAHLRTGDVRIAQGQVSAALASYRLSQTLREANVRRDPHDVEGQRDLGTVRLKLGLAQALLGETAASLATLRTAETTARQLTERDRSHAGWQRDLAEVRLGLASTLLARGMLAEARAAVAQARQELEALTARDPSNADWQLWLSEAVHADAELLTEQGELPAAAQAFKRAARLRRGLSQKDPSNQEWQHRMALTELGLAEVRHRQGQRARALTQAREVLAIRERLASGQAQNSGWQMELAWAHGLLADLLMPLPGATDRPQAALVEYRRAREILVPLATARAPVSWRHRLARLELRLAIALERGGDLAGAGQARGRARDLLGALLQLEPAHPAWQRDIALSRPAAAPP